MKSVYLKYIKEVVETAMYRYQNKVMQEVKEVVNMKEIAVEQKVKETVFVNAKRYIDGICQDLISETKKSEDKRTLISIDELLKIKTNFNKCDAFTTFIIKHGDIIDLIKSEIDDKLYCNIDIFVNKFVVILYELSAGRRFDTIISSFLDKKKIREVIKNSKVLTDLVVLCKANAKRHKKDSLPPKENIRRDSKAAISLSFNELPKNYLYKTA